LIASRQGANQGFRRDSRAEKKLRKTSEAPAQAPLFISFRRLQCLVHRFCLGLRISIVYHTVET